jgi:hypothetical protein
MVGVCKVRASTQAATLYSGWHQRTCERTCACATVRVRCAVRCPRCGLWGWSCTSWRSARTRSPATLRKWAARVASITLCPRCRGSHRRTPQVTAGLLACTLLVPSLWVHCVPPSLCSCIMCVPPLPSLPPPLRPSPNYCPAVGPHPLSQPLPGGGATAFVALAARMLACHPDDRPTLDSAAASLQRVAEELDRGGSTAALVDPLPALGGKCSGGDGAPGPATITVRFAAWRLGRARHRGWGWGVGETGPCVVGMVVAYWSPSALRTSVVPPTVYVPC